MASIFLVDDPSVPENKTFYHDEKLPPLPVPTIKQTLQKYLDSCKAIVSEQDYKTTTDICKRFENGEAKLLQQLLLKHAEKNRNWMEDWWLSKGYLETRIPLPISNFSGPATYMEHYLPLKNGTQIERSALGMYYLLKFWQIIRKELITSHKTGKGQQLTMHQFRYLFNTCRIPHRVKDELYHGFKTEAEGESPSHVIVFCKGYVFKLQGVNPVDGELYTPPMLEVMFQKIADICQGRPEGPGVPALTALDRDTWADVRDHLIEIDPKNHLILKEIETSLFVTSMDNTNPTSYTEMTYEAMSGNPSGRWYDKSYNSAWSLNGGNLSNCDHTPFDAMVLVSLVEFVTANIKQNKGIWNGSQDVPMNIEVEELSFVIDKKIKGHISTAIQESQKLYDNLDLVQVIFKNYGKSDLRPFKFHPDFVVQLCLQMAYMSVHGKPAPTYETATTRLFYHGRTETMRTCTPEAVEFCKEMLKNPIAGSAEYNNLYKLLQQAHQKFLKWMTDGSLNKGCDRHLLGLALICMENKMELPEIFLDPSYAATGGNGNFVLSTSCIGYFHAQGSVAPMVEHGYGFFYRINDKKIVYSLSSYKSCPETNTQKMCDHFEHALGYVFTLLSNSISQSKM